MASAKKLVLSDSYSESRVRARPASGTVAKRRIGGDEAADRMARLTGALESEVIPRLLLAHRSTPDVRSLPSRDAQVPSAADVGALVRLVLAQDMSGASEHLAAVRAHGISVEGVYLDLLAPAARQLGELWVADLCSFGDVTVGLCRLQQVMRELGPAFRAEAETRPHGRRALLAPVPGEQHSFGLVMVAEFFSRAGWDVWTGSAPGRADLVGQVRGTWFAVVGLSLASEVNLDVLATTIRAVRRASRNRAVGILVGGPVFTARPELAAIMGADATAGDGRQAVLQAQSLLTLLSPTVEQANGTF
jgi:methanogenic corrinoid protein MtbC1